MAERLRRSTRNRLGFSRVGSSPAGVVTFWSSHFLFSRWWWLLDDPTSVTYSLTLFLLSPISHLISCLFVSFEALARDNEDAGVRNTDTYLQRFALSWQHIRYWYIRVILFHAPKEYSSTTVWRKIATINGNRKTSHFAHIWSVYATIIVLITTCVSQYLSWINPSGTVLPVRT